MTAVGRPWLLLLAVFAVLYVAAELFVPIAFSVLLFLLLSPVVRAMHRRGIPPPLTAGVLVATMVTLIVLAMMNLTEPADRWVSEAPQTVRDMRGKLFAAKDQFSGIQELAEEVNELTSGESSPETQEVVVKEPDLLTSIFGYLPRTAAFTGIVIFLTYFLLASGDTLLRRMTQCGRSWKERRMIVAIARQVQNDLSRYLGTVTLINFGLGTAVAVTMHVLEVPNPLLWGAMAALFNFAPYVGALASAGVLTIVGFATFETLSDALVVPAAFLALTVIEGQLITPSVLGLRLAVHPLIVFLSVICWGWLWGVAGALMAVPIMTMLKVIADHVPSLAPVSRFIRRQPAAQPLAANAVAASKSYPSRTRRASKRSV